MAKFRKKPVVIEAVQFRTDTLDEVYGFLGMTDRDNFLDCGYGIDPIDGGFKLITLEGVMLVSLGDWIIRGVKGEVYLCKPEIFEATYDPVE